MGFQSWSAKGKRMKAVTLWSCLFMTALGVAAGEEEKAEESGSDHNVSKRSADWGYGGHRDSYDDDHYDDDYTFGYDFYPRYRQSYRPSPVWYPQPHQQYKSYNYVTYPNQYSPYRPLYEDYGHFLYSGHDDGHHDSGYGNVGYGGKHDKHDKKKKHDEHDHDEHHEDGYGKKTSHKKRRTGYGSRRRHHRLDYDFDYFRPRYFRP